MIISFRGLKHNKIIEKERKYGLDVRTRDFQHSIGLAPINFDCDSRKRAKILGMKLKEFFSDPYVILWRKSSSKRGIHFTIFLHGRQLYLDSGFSIHLRRKLGDCLGRVKADIEREKQNLPIGILFSNKNLREVTAWRTYKGKFK
jgi:hypothetical protein